MKYIYICLCVIIISCVTDDKVEPVVQTNVEVVKTFSLEDIDGDGEKDFVHFSMHFHSENNVTAKIKVESGTGMEIWLNEFKLNEYGLKDSEYWGRDSQGFILNENLVRRFVETSFGKNIYGPQVRRIKDITINKQFLKNHHKCKPNCDTGKMLDSIQKHTNIVLTYRTSEREKFFELVYCPEIKYMAIIGIGQY